MSESNSHHSAASKSFLAPVENLLALFFEKKAPKLPKKFTDFVVRILPWYIISVAVLIIFGLFSLYYITIMIPSSIYLDSIIMTFGDTFFVSILTKLVVVSLSMFAVPFLLNKQRFGWRMLFYATLLSFGESILTALILSLEPAKLVAYLIFSLTSFYLLFQLRAYYK